MSRARVAVCTSPVPTSVVLFNLQFVTLTWLFAPNNLFVFLSFFLFFDPLHFPFCTSYTSPVVVVVIVVAVVVIGCQCADHVALRPRTSGPFERLISRVDPFNSKHQKADALAHTTVVCRIAYGSGRDGQLDSSWNRAEVELSSRESFERISTAAAIESDPESQ